MTTARQALVLDGNNEMPAATRPLGADATIDDSEDDKKAKKVAVTVTARDIEAIICAVFFVNETEKKAKKRPIRKTKI